MSAIGLPVTTNRPSVRSLFRKHTAADIPNACSKAGGLRQRSRPSGQSWAQARPSGNRGPCGTRRGRYVHLRVGDIVPADIGVIEGNVSPPPGYKTSISICRTFLSEHAPKRADGETAAKLDPKPVGPAQLLYARKIAHGKGLTIPNDAKTNSTAMSAWIDFEPRRDARQASSQIRAEVDEINYASGRATEEASETQILHRCRFVGSRASKFSHRYAAADSFWQQGGRSETWRPLWLNGMVCTAWS